VEGPSDRDAMKRLLEPVIDRAFNTGSKVDFIPMHGKEPLLKKGPLKALNILRNKPGSWVFLLPDLYPPNKPFKHTTYQDIKSRLVEMFMTELRRKECDDRLKDRFLVHCFKYDLEALLLASEKILLERLNVSRFSRKWTRPVENQDHEHPPKRIVEGLFRDCGKKYKDTVDAPWILERTDYNELKDLCGQNFKPFLEDLLNILQL
jgi:hypothetical protein